MKLYFEDYLLEMSNVRGRYVKHPSELPFSFYFSSGVGVQHSIRVKPVFNPEKLKRSETGTLKLSDDWEYIPGPNDKDVPQSEIEKMKSFFKDYIVLFCAVWDEQMQDATLQDYLVGNITFDMLLQDLDFYEEYENELQQIHDVSTLDKFCRENNLVNFYGN